MKRDFSRTELGYKLYKPFVAKLLPRKIFTTASQKIIGGTKAMCWGDFSHVAEV